MPNDPRQLKELFLTAAAIASPVERAAWLDRACGDDSALRHHLEALLKAHNDPDGFLAQAGTPSEPTAATAPPFVPAETIGSRIGPYRLLQRLGEGGMGAVWVAEQTEPVKRRVALKVIKPGMDSAQVLRRFEVERQALALMDHTHIARVFDAGTTEAGRPYFVMELVHGVPLTRYCDELHLSVRERLELFVPVCQAIQHAHQKGIIHRDIKPSNVLVCMQDGKPVAKVIDFGVAKSISQPLTEQTLFTEYGAVVGTLEYMAPEQADMSPLGVDTRADVYALGVLLYELLTGSTPLDRKRLRGAAYVEMLRILKEDDPPRPSMRLTDSKELLPSLAAQRRTEPARLARAVQGELDWIVMKCLEKDRTRRYETASAVARDVERHLHDEPVEACPPSAVYRLKKVLRRHRGKVLTGVLVLLALVVAMIGTSWGMLRAERASEEQAEQRRLADEARRAAENVNRQLVHAQDRLEGTAARAWLLPLAKESGPLSEPEVSALEAVAAQRGQRLAQRFVREALTDPRLAPRLVGRAEYAWHGAIGLDDQQRAAVEALLRAELQSAEPGRRQNLACAAGALGGLSPETADLAATVLLQTMIKTTSDDRLSDLTAALSAVTRWLTPTRAAALAGTIIQVMSKEDNLLLLASWWQGLSAVCQRLQAPQAPEIAAALVEGIRQTPSADAASLLARQLSTVAALLEPTQATAVCGQAMDVFIQAMREAKHQTELAALADGLAAVATRTKAQKAAPALVLAMARTNDKAALYRLTVGLVAVVKHMEPRAAAQVCDQAAGRLVEAVHQTTEPDQLGSLPVGLAELAARMEPPRAAQACGQVADTLLRAMSKSTSATQLSLLASYLSSVAAHVQPERAARVCGQAADLLTRAMHESTGGQSLQSLATGVAALAAHMETMQAARVCGRVSKTLCRALVRARWGQELWFLCGGVSAVAARLDPKEAATAAAALAQVLPNLRLSRGWSEPLQEAFSKTIDRMDGKQAADLLVHFMRQETDVDALHTCANALSHAASRLAPAQAARVCDQAADRLGQRMSRATDPEDLSGLAQGLSAVAVDMEPTRAAAVRRQAATRLTHAMARTTDPRGLAWLAAGLSAVCTGLGAEEAATVTIPASAALIRAMYQNAAWPPGERWPGDMLPCLRALLDRNALQTPATDGALPDRAGTAGPGLPPVRVTGWRPRGPAPAPPALPAQTLVEVLKLPLCVGEARRIVLAQLGRRYHRTFADQWDFVRYVHEHRLNLDLTSPPKSQ